MDKTLEVGGAICTAALANLSLYSCVEAKKKLIQKKLPDWLFLLASQPDDITR